MGDGGQGGSGRREAPLRRGRKLAAHRAERNRGVPRHERPEGPRPRSAKRLSTNTESETGSRS
jgi:hypothetical protein